MSVRAFDWRDLLTLYACRDRSVFLDSVLVLTRGPWMVAGALFSYAVPGLGVTTVAHTTNEDGKSDLFGQVIQRRGAPFAHLTFLSPDTALEAGLQEAGHQDAFGLGEVLDILTAKSGEQGAFRLLADVDERTPAFESLRRSSFAIYTRQRIWQFGDQSKGKITPDSQDNRWRTAYQKDMTAIRNLYNNLVPGLVQQVEPFTANQRLIGLVCRQDGNLAAFAELSYGPRGIWVQPFIHPDTADVTGRLRSLLDSLPNRRSRPVYVCVRSYQSWLEPALDELEAVAGSQQAVMVKHLAVTQKVLQPMTVPTLETGRPEITTPIVRSESRMK
jgi:hypothetical protein